MVRSDACDTTCRGGFSYCSSRFSAAQVKSNARQMIAATDNKAATTAGRPDTEAAAEAQSLGVKINTFTFGMQDGTETTPDG